MNRNSLKVYSPQARKDFIKAVTAKAAQYGLTAAKVEPMTEKGDVVVIAGKPFPKALGDKRKRLEERIKKNGFEQTMEAMAYTWFNRLVAIRYMELHGYLEHGFRVLSHPEGHAQPEILEKAQYVDLPGLDQKKVIALKLDGTKEEELYRLLLTTQFNALSKAMPFLFEKIDDETELLFPDSLLNSDSLIRKLVTEIDEEDWKEVEIIGWLYQFYVEKEKERIDKYSKNKPVESQDIPAKTQLFTPNWIVKYLVQNTIGRQWLATYTQSSLRSKMEYYIEPAEQTPEVQEQLKAITPTSLNPEDLTLLDPACGSGHILVEAYDLFKAIYEERGYRSKDIPALILQKNLFGLEIDDRAAQLAAFALMMKARADYPRIFDSDVQPNVISFVESKGLDAEEIHYALMSPLPSERQTAEPPRPDGFLFETENNLFTHSAEVKAAEAKTNISLPNITKEDIVSLVALFENAKTFGSLIQVPLKLRNKVPAIEEWLALVLKYGDLTHKAVRNLSPLVLQAKLLLASYDAVVANPPYLGGKGLNGALKLFAEKSHPDGKIDLYAMFIDRAFDWLNPTGMNGMVTMQSWMFLSTFEDFRRRLLSQRSIESLLQMSSGVMGIAFGTSATIFRKASIPYLRGTYSYCDEGDLNPDQKPKSFPVQNSKHRQVCCEHYSAIQGSPVAYWLSEKAVGVFKGNQLETIAVSGGRCKTHDDAAYVRFWWEIVNSSIGVNQRWRFYEKGGEFRKYYGNRLFVVDWSESAKSFYSDHGGLSNEKYWATEAISWSDITSGQSGFRIKQSDMEYSSASPTLMFAKRTCDFFVLGLLNSSLTAYYLDVLNPTFHANVGDILRLPIVVDQGDTHSQVEHNTKELVEIAKTDWNSHEFSDKFLQSPLLSGDSKIIIGWEKWYAHCEHRRNQFRSLEQHNNELLVDSSGLLGEVAVDVLDHHISLLSPEREEDTKRLVSYIVGCAMGRYSVDKPGLVYAHSGNEGFEPNQYQTFRADDDGIIPLLETDWGIRDDAANRIFEFVSVAWPKEHLDENLKFIADSITPSNGEQPKDTIRRYLATGFYKHHLSMYKKRPIYWLFSSGKQRAFQCLVYLHRYNEGTLARMRTEYVIPLMGKMSARLEHLQGPPEQKGAGGEIAATSAVTVKRKLEKERDNIKKQLAELQSFDEKLRHYADLGIKLDLDDGVKVNYGKFSDPEIGDILAEVKAICGTKDED